MADTLGDLIDKLVIADIRGWHIEDERREFVRMANLYSDNTEPQARRGKELLDLVAKVNKERNALIDQINAGLAVLIDKARNKDSTFELTADELLGTGKNKFYKTEDRK